MAMLTMTVTITMMTTIDYHLLLESDGMIAAILYFLFIFNENARKNSLATKVMGGGRGNVGCFFVLSMATVMAMSTTMTTMIDHRLFYDSDGTIAAIIYFSFYIEGIRGGERGIWSWFIVMRMVRATAMATATV